MKKVITVLFFLNASILAAQHTVTDFSLVNVVDESNVSLSQFSSMKGVAVIFTSNVCPYDGYYRDRIRTLAEGYDGKIQFLLINSHPGKEESAEEMKEAYVGMGVSIPYLADKDQVAKHSLGARKSPEVFLVVKGKIVYSGAIDDNAQMASGVTHSYLKTAIDHVLSGSTESVHSPAVAGCTIKKK